MNIQTPPNTSSTNTMKSDKELGEIGATAAAETKPSQMLMELDASCVDS